MKYRINWLIGLLLLQILLAVVLIGSGPGDEQVSTTVLEFDIERVDKMVVADGEGQSVTLVKQNQQWLGSDTKADNNKVEAILVKLKELPAPWPVATTADSAQRFEVGADNFQRKIQLFSASETLAHLYLGTSPGFQRVHARQADSDEVYSVALSNFEFSTKLDDWLDKGVLATTDVPERIEVSFIDDPARQEVLQQSPEGWLYNEAAANQDAANTYASRFATLQVLGVAQLVDAQELATITLSVGGRQHSLVLSRMPDEGEYLIQKAGEQQRYRLASYVAEQLLLTDADFSPQAVDTARFEKTP